MVDDDRANTMLGSLLPRSLEALQRASGLPLVLAGTTRRTGSGRRLTLNHFRGNLGDSLVDLEIDQGRGLGGTVVIRGTACRVNDYAEASAITHEYDRLVVDGEKITSLFAFPLKAGGIVRGVLYGAVRDRLPIGDVALRHAGTVAARLSRDLEDVLRERTETSPAAAAGDAAAAVAELGTLTPSVTDPVLRRRLERIHRALITGGEPTGSSRSHGHTPLSPREHDVLKLVAIGRTNRDIAPELGLRPETVKAYLRSAMRKLEVGNRTAAVHAARSVGIL